MCIFLKIDSKAQSALGDTKLAVITDLHYLGSELRDIGYKTQEVSQSTGKNIIASSEVLDEAIAKIDSANINVLLIAGDLTFEGEEKSHRELKNKLDVLKNKGVRILVIPGNHDINNPNAKGYKGNTEYKTASISQKEFVDIYSDFGYEDALARDVTSLSYVSPIDSATWLIALDLIDYTSDGNRNVAKLQPDLREWLIKVLNEAQEKNKRVMVMMHWGLLEHVPMQTQFLPSYLVSGAEGLRNLLVNHGVEIVFTGHFHVNDIQMFTTEEGKSIYDIATGALVSYPYPIRFANLDYQSLDVSTVFLESTLSFPNLKEDSKQILLRLTRERSLPYLKRTKFLNFSDANLVALSRVMAKYFVASMGGDEIVNKETIEEVQELFREEGFPIYDISDNLATWSSIPDNTYRIDFRISK